MALHEEFLPLKDELSFHRTDGVGQYNGFLGGRPVSVYLCGPGLKRKSKFSDWLEQYSFSRIVNIGFAGALTRSLKLGQRFAGKNHPSEKKQTFSFIRSRGEILDHGWIDLFSVMTRKKTYS